MGQLLVKRVQGTYVRVGLKRDPDLGKVARAAPHSLLCQRSLPDGDGAALAPELVATRSSNAETHQHHPGRVPGWVPRLPGPTTVGLGPEPWPRRDMWAGVCLQEQLLCASSTPLAPSTSLQLL